MVKPDQERSHSLGSKSANGHGYSLAGGLRSERRKRLIGIGGKETSGFGGVLQGRIPGAVPPATGHQGESAGLCYLPGLSKAVDGKQPDRQHDGR